MIPYSKQSISDDDIDAVVRTLRSDFITQGQATPAFERALAGYTGAKYGVAVNSGTSALHLACLSLGLGRGDYLWTSPVSFVASANCALYCGAHVDFIDVSAEVPLMDVNALEQKLERAKKSNRLPKIVIPVHYAGQSCDMRAIAALAKQYQFHVIEDACHALGGSYQEKPIGNCQYSDIATFSFHPVKSITTGEGGMALTNRKELHEKMTLLRSHGITRDPNKMTTASEGDWYYQQLELGFNYRMTDIHAALGLSQLYRLDSFIRKRRAVAERYDDLLKSSAQQTWSLPIPDRQSAYHLYPVRISSDGKQTRARVFERMRQNGVGVNVHYIPIHTQPHYRNYRITPCPNAEKYYAETISLPIYPDLSETEQATVMNVFRKAVADV